MSRLSLALLCSLPVHLLIVAPAAAQSGELSSCKVSQMEGDRFDRQPDRTRVFGSSDLSVRIDCDDMQFFADFVELFNETDIVAARGHVVFVSAGNRISADRMEFNTRTRTGTFYDAYGTALLGDRVDRSLFGTQEPYAFFWGEELEKLGPTKYKITRGGFTTCVQPTPRWEIASGSMTVNLNDYALLTNSVFRVKGVPVMYLPVFYYPIQEDDRATGFLLPTYGSSTVRGQSLSNAFFWAIDRSQDATFFHDWFSKTGQGYGGEYRYVAGAGSEGTTKVSFLNERALEAAENDGIPRPASTSYTITGAMTQQLPASLNARANVYYFSSIQAQQRYMQNVYDATNRRRNFSANLTGTWGPNVLNAVVNRNDYFTFQPATESVPEGEIVDTTGGAPRITFNRSERPIGGSPVYFGATGEYVTLLRRQTVPGRPEVDQGVTRLDVVPTIRIPFNRWPFLTVNSAVSWRGTYWTERFDPAATDPALSQIPEGIGRRFFDFNSRITGPVLTRIFDNPGGGYAERFKHVIEPAVTVQRITPFDDFDRIVKLEGTDFEAGNITRFIYGLTNRLYAKKTVAREIASVSVTQTYLTDANAAQFERDYQNGFRTRPPTKFLPIAMAARTTPTERIQADFRTEYDVTVDAFTSFAANGSVSHSDWLTTSGGWSQRRFVEDLPGFDNPAGANNYLNAAVNLRARRNTLGGTYTFNYDLRNDRYLSQRWVAYYNAQCCGIGVEYQMFDFGASGVGFGVPRDRRFNLSFTLAGIGTFSNLFGAFGGQQGRE